MWEEQWQAPGASRGLAASKHMHNAFATGAVGIAFATTRGGMSASKCKHPQNWKYITYCIIIRQYETGKGNGRMNKWKSVPRDNMNGKRVYSTKIIHE